jgi:hypothetical protein
MVEDGVDGVLTVRLVVEPDPESDPEVCDRLTRQLRAELSELDVESADLAAGGPAPDHAKAADPVSLGAIVVALSASGGVFTSVVETLRDWLGRHSGRHRIAMTIDGDTIELEQATAAQQDELVLAFIRRHSGDQ